MTLDRFYPIFDSVAWFERMLPLGVRFAQLRVKDRAEDELRPIVERVRDLCGAYGATLVVNDHWRLAIELGCDFVHRGQEDLVAARPAARMTRPAPWSSRQSGPLRPRARSAGSCPCSGGSS